MERVYEFRSQWTFCKPGSVVCLARGAFVTEYIAFSEFDSLFGGFIKAETRRGTEYLGVWSRRVAGRFRQTLRDRGATLEIVREEPAVHVTRWGYHRHGYTKET